MLEGLLFLFSFLRSRLKRGGCSPKVSLSRAGRGGDFYFLPGRQNSETAHGAPPPAGAHKGFQQPPSKPRSGPVPTPLTTGPLRGMLLGNGGGGERKQRAAFGARGGPWGSVGPGGRGPLERLRTWERPGPGRPLGAGGDLALGPWRRGRPGLAQRRRLQEARGFGLRRRLVPRPLSRPRSVRETAALRPAPSAAQAPAPAPTSTWGPIETVRHAPPPPPPGAAAAALGRGRGGGAGGGAAGRLSPPRSLGPHGGGGRRVPAWLLSASGGADRSWSTRRTRRSRAPAPRGCPRLFDSPQNPAPPPSARRGRRRVTAAPRGPEAPGAPAASVPVRGRLGAAAQQAAPGAASRPPDSPACRGGRAGASRSPRPCGGQRGALTPGGPDLRGGSQERSARLTVDARKIKIRGEGAWRQRQGSRTRTSVGAQVCSMTRCRPAGGLVRKEGSGEALPPAWLAAARGRRNAVKMHSPRPRPFQFTAGIYPSRSYLRCPGFSLLPFLLASRDVQKMHYLSMKFPSFSSSTSSVQ